jgi:hypothetical protein
MNAQEAKIAGCRKAWIAFVAALCCLLIYVLACVLSPVGWSPDSSKIAILVTPHGEHPDIFAIYTYDIATGDRVLLDEVKADGALSAPAWSPDGKWIAYYKVEPAPSPEVIPSSESDATVPAGDGSGNTTEGKTEQPNPPTITQELFSEENKMLPSLMLELMKELVEEQEDVETFDVKLIMVTPDAKERKILQVMKWMGDMGDDDVREAMMHMRPSWSADCKRLFYVRMIEHLFYTGSIEIATGKTYAHLAGSIGTPIVSSDGKWAASYLEHDEMLVAARIDGNMCNYFRLDLEMDKQFMQDVVFWSPDSKNVFVLAEDSILHAVDITSGQIEQYTVPDANNIAYYTLSSTGEKLYYIAGLNEEEEIDFTDRIFSLRYMDLQNKSTGTVFSFSGFPEHSKGGRFSIAPNGKIVLLRAIIENGYERAISLLIFCDGKTQKVVSTDRWLRKPFYDDSNLIFEEKLIGNWRGEYEQISITEGALEKTYTLTWTEDDEERHAAANLVQLKDMMFLGVFLYESILEKKDSSGSHLLPDFFFRVHQIEPKLLLQPMGYDEVAEMLKEDAGPLKREDTETEDIVEFERTNSSPENSG